MAAFYQRLIIVAVSRCTQYLYFIVFQNFVYFIGHTSGDDQPMFGVWPDTKSRRIWK